MCIRDSFKTREYWTIAADTTKEGKGFEARLTQFEGGKVEQFTIGDESRAREVERGARAAATAASTSAWEASAIRVRC